MKINLRGKRAQACGASLGLILAFSACERGGSSPSRYQPSERRLGELQENGSSRGDGGRRVTLDPAMLEKERAGQAETRMDSRSPGPRASNSAPR